MGSGLVSNRCIKQHKPPPKPINKQTTFIYTQPILVSRTYPGPDYILAPMNPFWTILSLFLFLFLFFFFETFKPFFESSKERTTCNIYSSKKKKKRVYYIRKYNWLDYLMYELRIDDFFFFFWEYDTSNDHGHLI